MNQMTDDDKKEDTPNASTAKALSEALSRARWWALPWERRLSGL
jgi:hypothetical protein